MHCNQMSLFYLHAQANKISLSHAVVLIHTMPAYYFTHIHTHTLRIVSIWDSNIIAIGYIRSFPYRCSPQFLQQFGPSVFTVSCLAHACVKGGISSIWTFYKRLPCIN